jgi:signal transduction histidine kinase/CheY-like chemotaxis protein
VDIEVAQKSDAGRIRSLAGRLARRTLFWKYVLLFIAVMSLALLINSFVDIWFIYQEHRAVLIRAQKEQANSAAEKISQFITEIEGQLEWTTHLSWAVASREQRELDGARLLRQVPAITELALWDDQGREQLHLSRQAMDRIGGNTDFSADERYKSAIANKVYYGPVIFRNGSEPFMTLAVAGARGDSGVSVADINLTHIWDVITQIRVGRTGKAYVVDGDGRLIAHPDISLVLRNTDFSPLTQVRSARAYADTADPELARTALDISGQRVLTAYAKAAPLNWFVFVELPEQEANEPLYAAIQRSSIIVIGGLILALGAALLLARRIVIPIQILTAGAARIGAGMLNHRIDITTGDELETLGNQLNDMAAQLQASYGMLERKVEERTHQLQIANQSKSRFLAVASHDLRQPLHALNLFVAQLRTEKDPAERRRLAGRIDAAVANMNELFNALLDISKLDAGALSASISEFPINSVLKRIESVFTAAAREKGLRLRIVPCSAWIRSDAILLERILLNLVSNAIRYTTAGGVVLGCRRAGRQLRVEVCDTGVGIPENQHRNIFAEFYQIQAPDRKDRDGLGLGLAIVERLCALLKHSIGFSSIVGKGSRFYVSIPTAPSRVSFQKSAPVGESKVDPLVNKLIVVIDDDALVLESTGGLLRSWGCRVITAESDQHALASIDGSKPDLIISDFRLKNGRTGIGAIAQMRDAFESDIPAFLISGDILPERLQQAQENGYQLLHKPLAPMTLRAIMSRLLRVSS